MGRAGAEVDVASSIPVPQNVSTDPARSVLLTSRNPPNAVTIYNDFYNIGGYFPDQPIFNDPQFCTNGQWSSARNGFVGLFPGSVARFTFGTAVQSVGAMLNYAPTCGDGSQRAPLLRLLGESGNVLKSFDIDALGRIITPNQQDAGMLRGATRAAGDIFAVEFVGGFLVLDDLMYVDAAQLPPSTTVPEPSTVALFAVGLGMIAIRARRRVVTRTSHGVNG